MKKAYKDAVFFAKWCKNHGLDPKEIAELCSMIEKSVRYWEQNQNSDDPKYQQLLNQVKKHAKDVVGFKEVDWPGLYPTFTDQGGFEVHLPYLD